MKLSLLKTETEGSFYRLEEALDAAEFAESKLLLLR